MDDIIANFEADCEAVGVRPTAALTAGGVNKAQWWRWKSGQFMPSMRSFAKAKAGLAALTPASDAPQKTSQAA
jgi:hypothetical protein